MPDIHRTTCSAIRFINLVLLTQFFIIRECSRGSQRGDPIVARLITSRNEVANRAANVAEIVLKLSCFTNARRDRDIARKLLNVASIMADD